MAQKKALSITIDIDTFHDLEFVAAYRGVNRSALIQMALSDYVREQRAIIERNNKTLLDMLGGVE